MISKKKLIGIFLILLSPMILTFLSPFLYGLVMWIIYKGDLAMINQSILNGIAYILIFNHFLVFILMWMYMKKNTISWNQIGVSLKELSVSKCLIGLIVGLVCFGALNFLPNILGLVELQKSSNANGMIYFIGSITVAPIIEELIFRGFGVSELNKIINWKVTIIVCALCFSLLHIYNGVSGLVTAFVAGVVLGVTLIRTKSVFPCIIAHFTMNICIGITYVLAYMKS
ncbi:type II CAAX endopeptidase family protein [Clostridiaceae bacterium M8S5]|nr:type II CAAX endopeptidase family protein [Clostridiaceae bacterium M8S5]